jgi:hypothetical protein
VVFMAANSQIPSTFRADQQLLRPGREPMNVAA